jgi:DIS3-like exonuclease 1
LDYRSMSPCVMVEQDGSAWSHESPAPQERSKIRKLLQNYPNRVVSFCDLSVREEDHDEWDMMGYATMSMSERSQHALVRAGNMIHQYCSGADILILSSDSEFVKQFPSEDGVDLVVMNQLLDQLVEKQQVLSDNIDTLAELKTRCEQDYRLRNTPSVKSGTKEIAKYLSDEDISEGLRNKTLAKGRLNVTKENPKEAFVVASSGDSYFINQQLGHFNRALHQDIVVLQPLAESDWGRPVGRRRLVHHRDDDDDGPTSEVDSSPPVPSARVVAVTESSRRLFVATMVDVPMNDESACLVIPMDVRIPKIRIKTSGWRRFVGNRLLIQLDAWDLGSNFPAGHCVEILGPVAGLETEIKCLLHENQLDLEPFSAAALACLPPEGPDWMIPAEEMERRLDLRATHRIFSVDPPGCQDIDDTMHARGECFEVSNVFIAT